MSLLKVTALHKRFNLEAGFFARFGRFVNAVNDISFSIGKNESYGLVGESGCGKTTTARLLVRMYEADSGSICFNEEKSSRKGAELAKDAKKIEEKNEEGIDVRRLEKEALRGYREKVRYVFQDPAKSLNPRMSVYEVLVSGCRKPLRKKGVGEKELYKKAGDILEEVGLQAADLEKRPSEFSGGQRQRISIARALLMEPELLICDEVVSALDVSIQGQILNLLLDIRKKRNMSFLFIAHDLKVACYFCDRIGVMYKGEMMEESPAADLYKEALHPYTKLLFSSAAGIEEEIREDLHAKAQSTPSSQREEEEEGLRKKEEKSNLKLKNSSFASSASFAPLREISSLSCSFLQRCPIASERCYCEHPQLVEIKPNHFIRCFNYDTANTSPCNP